MPIRSRAVAVAIGLVLAAGPAGCQDGNRATSWTAPVAGGSTPPSSPAAGPSTAGPSDAGPSASAQRPGGSGAAPLDLAAAAGRTIAIDPGHNGGNAAHPSVVNALVPMGTGTKACDTTGTQTDGGYPEHAFTYDVAMRLAALLRAAGARVVMTRSSDTGVGPCVNERAAIGNAAHAAVAISIHGDGGPASGHGFHVLEPARVGAPSDAIVATSHQLALRIRDSYRAHTGIPPSTYIGSNGIDTRGDMGGLNLSTVPKVMVECGNMRNAGDAALMVSPAERQRMAEGLAAGIAAYLAG